MNEIKIIVTDKYVPGSGFTTARLKAKQAGTEVGNDFDEAVVKATRGTGTKVSTRLGTELKAGNKELNLLQGQALKLNKAFDLLNDKHVLSKADFKNAADGFMQVGTQIRVASKGLDGLHAQALKLNKAFDDTNDKNLLSKVDFQGALDGITGVDKQVRTTSKDLDGLHTQALRLNKVFDEARDKNLLSDADFKSITMRFKGVEEQAEVSGKRASENFNKGVELGVGGGSGGPKGFEKLVNASLMGVGGTIAASGGTFGAALGVAVVGGLATALTAGGVVGLAGFLLKDNEAVGKAWSKTWEGVVDDAKRRAGFLEEEFVAGAERTAVAWDTKLGPALERIFVNAKPLVDDFIDMPTNWLDALAPGVEKAVKNAGPAVEGLDLLGQAIFKGFGDGLGDMSEHSDDFKTAMVLAGDAIGGALKGTLSTMGDVAKWFADNQESAKNFGAKATEVFQTAGKEAGLLADEMAAIFAPDGKNAKGDDWWVAFQKMVAGDDYKPPVKGDYDDARNLGDLGRKIGTAVDYTGQAIKNDFPGADSTAAVQGSNLDSMLQILKVRKDMNDEMGKLNYLQSIGLGQSQAAIDANLALSESQATLLAVGAQMTTVTGNNTAANAAYIDEINRMTEAGLPASDALLKTVEGMNSAELAALGATVRMDDLGNAIVSIPGQKDITVNAATLAAQDAVYAVQNAVNSLTGRTVYVNVVTTGVASAANAVATAAANAAAAIANRASGGITSTAHAATGGARGGDIVMNEQGPEAVRLPNGSTVMPAGATRALEERWASGGGSGPTRIILEWAPNAGDTLISGLKNAIRVRGGDPTVLGP